MLVSGPEAFDGSPNARELIHARERRLKGHKRARLESPEALARWTGGSGTAPLVYRWPTAQNILADIYAGLYRTRRPLGGTFAGLGTVRGVCARAQTPDEA